MKIVKTYRINKMICDELKKTIKDLNVTETSFVEMALIEKMARIQAKKNEMSINTI